EATDHVEYRDAGFGTDFAVNELAEDDLVQGLSRVLFWRKDLYSSQAQMGLIGRGAHDKFGPDNPDHLAGIGGDGRGDQFGHCKPWNGTTDLGQLDAVLDGVVGGEAKLSPATAQKLGGTPEKAANGVPVVLADGGDIGLK